jgi:tight adherence protein C
MEYLLALARSITNDPATLATAVTFLAAGIVFVFGLGVSYLVLGASDPIRRRMKGISVKEEAPSGRLLLRVESMLGPAAAYVLPKEQIERDKITTKLVHAGYRGPNALQTFFATKAVLAIVLPAVVFVSTLFVPDMTATSVLIYTVVASAVGVLAPNIVLEKLVQIRARKLKNGFPDALDLMVVCVEAGLGLSQAIQRVAEELVVSHPELAAELALVNAEIRAGVERVAALKNLAARTGLQEITGLVSLLAQTLRFGTGVADSLRVYSEEFRDMRTQKAEEAAAKMGTKMIFPLIIFLFPAFFVVAIGPAVMGLAEAFSQF